MKETNKPNELKLTILHSLAVKTVLQVHVIVIEELCCYNMWRRRDKYFTGKRIIRTLKTKLSTFHEWSISQHINCSKAIGEECSARNHDSEKERIRYACTRERNVNECNFLYLLVPRHFRYSDVIRLFKHFSNYYSHRRKASTWHA